MFTSLSQRLRNLFRDESGPTAVEYAVMLALIIVICLLAIQAIGTSTSRTYSTINNALDPKTDGNPDGNGQI